MILYGPRSTPPAADNTLARAVDITTRRPEATTPLAAVLAQVGVTA